MDEERPSWVLKLKRFCGECVRVLKITKKPTTFEFKTIVKASGLGMAIIGLIGFLIQMMKAIFFPPKIT
ncbi:protein translocase SEC61 complex subunit gamma [Candidatus Woesearchaeota archaeon]|nr:protein translocase SEC61 complex subunit gamma [Candidatus Woesearchaeota archaeon]